MPKEPEDLNLSDDCGDGIRFVFNYASNRPVGIDFSSLEMAFSDPQKLMDMANWLLDAAAYLNHQQRKKRRHAVGSLPPTIDDILSDFDDL